MKSFIFVLASTFIIGMFTGMYGYFLSTNGSEPMFGGFFNGSQQQRGYEVVADMYGGCASLGCVSYRISDSGEYDVLVSRRGGEDERIDGTLSIRQRSELTSLLQSSTLERISNTQFTGTCPITFDGNAYRYEIRIADTRYFIDTCEQNVEGERLFDLLETYFEAS